jgi:protein-S-isoprenylcysteine O-methyltransferase Ste14
MPASFAEKYGQVLSPPVFAVLVLALAGLIYTQSLFGQDPVSIGLQAVAVALMLWARVTFGRRSFHFKANPTGPYRFMRHPIYAAILLFVWTGVAVHASPRSVALGLVMTGMTSVRILFEEALVRRTYPEYDDYARRTKRIVPFLF